jgi:hypothetical protein
LLSFPFFLKVVPPVPLPGSTPGRIGGGLYGNGKNKKLSAGRTEELNRIRRESSRAEETEHMEKRDDTEGKRVWTDTPRISVQNRLHFEGFLMR